MISTETRPRVFSPRGGLSGTGGETRRRDALLRRFGNRMSVNHALTRALVSWQSNKRAPGFRWFKYKEGFSTRLVDYLLGHMEGKGLLLDPFAGTGVAPIIASGRGWEGIGIEILPVGIRVANGWLTALSVDPRIFRRRAIALQDALERPEQTDLSEQDWFPHISITQKAFPQDSERAIAAARHWLRQAEPGPATDLLGLAAMSALEDASWTSKDGQYLRWDHRSGRNMKTRMEKRCVLPYGESLRDKLSAIQTDLPLLVERYSPGSVHIVEDSCYNALPSLPSNSIDAVITSPPYANRYDYTRTYALELAWLGYDHQGITAMRQRLLSATVENRSKRGELTTRYGDALALFDRHEAIAEISDSLEAVNARGELANPHVIRLVRNYFMEMTVVIGELARVCKPGASVFMVNDNVQYHGEEVPVDLILSDLAEQFGFQTRLIWTLARGKGNASQQMGRFGRRELRKCVYWWVRR